MLELQKQFQNFIDKHSLIADGEKVLLAVSGGLDSMVMLELFHRSDYKILVAHCNFGLRGSESDGDEAFVMDWTQGRGIECLVKQVELIGNSTQLGAREQRYKWFAGIREQRGFQKVATAHHLNDSLETTLLNFSRGTGIKGLAGIPVINDHVIRPLLFATRGELHSFAMDVGLSWREDSSNEKTAYDRNKVRLEVIPKLKELNPALESTFKITNERMIILAQLVRKRAEEVLHKYFDGSDKRLELSWIKEDSDLLILHEILSTYGFSYVTTKEVWKARTISGKTFEATNWKVTIDRNALFLVPNAKRSIAEVVIEKEGVYQVGDNELQIESVAEEDTLNLISKNQSSVVLEASRLTFPLTLRKWQQGDTFQPLGMKGTKKVSDFLIDSKVPLAKKEEVLVLESKGEIAWVVGHRISEKFKVDSRSNEMLRLKFI